MNDTSKDMEQKVAEIMGIKTPSERVRMASNMFATSKKMIKAGLEKEWGRTLTNGELRRETFLRLYRDCFTDKEIEKICAEIPNM